MLAFGVLPVCFVDFDMNGLTAPFEFLAAAAGAAAVRVQRHVLHPVGGEESDSLITLAISRGGGNGGADCDEEIGWFDRCGFLFHVSAGDNLSMQSLPAAPAAPVPLLPSTLCSPRSGARRRESSCAASPFFKEYCHMT